MDQTITTNAQPLSPAPPCFHVLMIDDHEVVRKGLQALASTDTSVEVIWRSASSLHDALELAAQAPLCDLALLDLNLPDSKGLEGLRQFVSSFPNMAVAVFSGTTDEVIIAQAIREGAAYFIPKSGDAWLSWKAITALLLKKNPDSSIQQTQQEKFANAAMPHLALSSLNATQHRVLELLLAGMSNREIAQATQLASGTVRNSVSAILLAFDVRTRTHLLSIFR